MSYSKGKTWSALKKAWRAYKIAKNKNDKERMKKYSDIINALQRELGLQETKFEEKV